MVPGLTCDNVVSCICSNEQNNMEVRQQGAGRLSLGAHGKTSNEAVRGDMRRVSFELREVGSKITFDEILIIMKKTGWSGETYKYMCMKSMSTRWTLRTRTLDRNMLRWEMVRVGEKGEKVGEGDRKMDLEALNEEKISSWSV